MAITQIIKKMKQMEMKVTIMMNSITSQENLLKNSILRTKKGKVSTFIYMKMLYIIFIVKRNEIADRYKARVTNFLKEMAEGPV